MGDFFKFCGLLLIKKKKKWKKIIWKSEKQKYTIPNYLMQATFFSANIRYTQNRLIWTLYFLSNWLFLLLYPVHSIFRFKICCPVCLFSVQKIRILPENDSWFWNKKWNEPDMALVGKYRFNYCLNLELQNKFIKSARIFH